MFLHRLLAVSRAIWQRQRLAREVWEGEGLPGDRGILEFLHAHASPGQDAVALTLARLGGPVGRSVLAGGIGLLLVVRASRRPKAGEWVETPEVGRSAEAIGSPTT